MSTDLNDDLSDLLGGAPVAQPQQRQLPQDEQLARIRDSIPAAPMGHKETCPKCRGTGRFTTYSGRTLGECFACKGKGHHVYKQSYEQRLAARTKAAQRRAADVQSSWADFVARRPEVAAWLDAKAATFEFAHSLREAAIKFGDLTAGQLAAAERCMARDVERDQQRAAAKAAQQSRAQEASVAVPQAAALFAVLNERKGKVMIAGFQFSLAPSHGRNAGAIYVKDGGVYVGKIVPGTHVFYPGHDFDPARGEALKQAITDPAGTVRAYAAETARRLAEAAAEGRELTLPCGCCGIMLTDPVSVARGIGPICAGKWGF
jgi:hypothetical protein